MRIEPLKTNRLFVTIITAAIVIITGCVDTNKDLYDSTYKTTNPLAFSAPEDFDWSTTASQSLTVEVKDEFEGQYYYTISIYRNDPLTSNNDTLLAKGVTNKKQTFSTSVTVDKKMTCLFIEQTDPKGRISVFPYEIPTDHSAMDCKLYYVATSTKSSTASLVAKRTSQAINDMPDYTSIPSGSTEISSYGTSNTLQSNTNYKITSDYSGSITNYGNNTNIKLYVSAKWTIPSSFYTVQSGLEIIVMNGGEISCANNLSFVNNSILTIMPGGKADFNNLTFTNSDPAGIRNWGTLSVKSSLIESSGASLYNKGIITAANLTVNSNSNIANDNSIKINGSVNLLSNFILNNNSYFHASGITANSSATINNTGTILADETISLTNPTINNDCDITANYIDLEGCTLNMDQGYIGANNMTIGGCTVKLYNGSMIESKDTLDHKSWADTYYGTGTNKSLIKAVTIIGQGFTYSGNLVIEAQTHVEELAWGNYYVLNGASITTLGGSDVYIETCGGTKNEGNSGSDPTDPTFPIKVSNSQYYSYIFEDQWPVYGDYDMNDIVLKMINKTMYVNQSNNVVQFSITMELCAVGAQYQIGAALMLDQIPSSAIKSLTYSSNTPSSFNVTNVGIEKNQDYAVIPLFDEAHKLLTGNSSSQLINTVSGSTTYNPKTLTITAEISSGSKISSEALNNNLLNVFIIVAKNTLTDTYINEMNKNTSERNEIHIIGFKPTGYANTDIFGNNNDNSSITDGRYYQSKDNLAWGIMVSTDFKWPKEYINIKYAYPKFEGWVTTGGTLYTSWYNDYTSGKIYGE